MLTPAASLRAPSHRRASPPDSRDSRAMEGLLAHSFQRPLKRLSGRWMAFCDQGLRAPSILGILCPSISLPLSGVWTYGYSKIDGC